MSLNLRANIVIRAPAERLFELICTPERLPEWNVSVNNGRRATADQAVCLGSRAVFRGKLLGQSLESETEVIDFEPPRLFATRAIRGPRLTTRFELHSQPDGTRVVVDVIGEVPGGVLGSRVAEGFLRKELTASLIRLRAIGESDRTDPISPVP
jgi:uncharacterized protein YndB with AHSA1/START domain